MPPSLDVSVSSRLTPEGHEGVLIDAPRNLWMKLASAPFCARTKYRTCRIRAMTPYRQAYACRAIRAVGVPVLICADLTSRKSRRSPRRNGGPRHATLWLSLSRMNLAQKSSRMPYGGQLKIFIAPVDELRPGAQTQSQGIIRRSVGQNKSSTSSISFQNVKRTLPRYQ